MRCLREKGVTGMAPYRIVTDATADCSGEWLAALPSFDVIPMQVEIGGQNHAYGPGGELSAEQFYELQKAGSFASTSQISPVAYFQCFEPMLQAGYDILYLCFSSGMSGTFQSARVCAQELHEKYPDRAIVCIDTLAASVGEGFLVCEAVRRKSEGASLEELAGWVTRNRLRVSHWFTVDGFEHLRRGGRVSAGAALIGTALQVKPLLQVDHSGKLAVAEKPRGRKQAVTALLARMERGWTPELGKCVVVGHGACPEGALALREAVCDRFPEARVFTADIGPVIGAHTGPGMLALVYWGETR